MDWSPQAYKKYVPLVGSATAQQIVRKNNEAWRAFLALKRMEKNGKLPSTIKRVKPPATGNGMDDTCSGYCFAATATTYEKAAWGCRVISPYPSRANQNGLANKAAQRLRGIHCRRSDVSFNL